MAWTALVQSVGTVTGPSDAQTKMSRLPAVRACAHVTATAAVGAAPLLVDPHTPSELPWTSVSGTSYPQENDDDRPASRTGRSVIAES